MDSLHLLGGIGAAAHAPILTHAAPGLLGLDDWQRVPPPGELGRRMEAPSHARWRSFRESEESRYVALVLPPSTPSAPGPFAPGAAPRIGGAWLLAGAILQGFTEVGWGAVPPGWTAGPDAAGPLAVRIENPTALAQLGFIAAVPVPSGAAFPLRPTVQRPKRYSRDDATRQAEARARLDHVMAMGRYAQALTVVGRRQRRAGADAGTIRRSLSDWLAPHADGEDAPLAVARVEVQPARRHGTPLLVAWLAPQPGSVALEPEPVALDVL